MVEVEETVCERREERGTYGQAVLLVGGRGGGRELGRVGGRELQAVALHRTGLRDVGHQCLQGQVVFLTELIAGRHIPHKVHLEHGTRNTWRGRAQISNATESVGPFCRLRVYSITKSVLFVTYAQEEKIPTGICSNCCILHTMLDTLINITACLMHVEAHRRESISK